jgi:hypothetical protein
VGCPIRRSRDQRALASTPGFSQRATSFIASRCQGIHQMPLPQRLIAKTRRLQRQAPLPDRPSREDTHPKKPEARTRKANRHPHSTPELLRHSPKHPSRHQHHADSLGRRLGSLPLHSVKDHTAQRTEVPRANSSFPIALDARPLPPLSRCKRTAGAARDERHLVSFVRWRRAALAPWWR